MSKAPLQTIVQNNDIRFGEATLVLTILLHRPFHEFAVKLCGHAVMVPLVGIHGPNQRAQIFMFLNSVGLCRPRVLIFAAATFINSL